MASNPKASAPPRSSVEATTIPGEEGSPGPATKGSGCRYPPSGHHRKRQTQSCSSLVWDSRVGLACCSAWRIPSHPHDASTGPMMAPCGPVHLTNRSSVAAQEGLGSAVQVAGVPHQTGDAAGPMLTAAMPRQNLREPIFSLIRIWRRAQPLYVSAARRGVPSR
jgi:hypothetical protein